MPIQEILLPALVRHTEQLPHLHLLVCEICGTKADFNPSEPGDLEEARRIIERHRCKGQ